MAASTYPSSLIEITCLQNLTYVTPATCRTSIPTGTGLRQTVAEPAIETARATQPVISLFLSLMHPRSDHISEFP